MAAIVAIAFGLTPAFAQSSLPRAQVGVAYSFQVATSPAAPAGTVYAATGLPVGLSINASSGLIAGTPNAAGTSTGAISLTTDGVTNSFNYLLVVDPAAGTPAITSAATAAATAGAAFTYTVTADNSPTSFNVGALPAGLTFASPTISGTPVTPGTYSIPLSANNAIGTGATTTLVLTVSPAGPVPAITSPLTADVAVGAAFAYTITASNTPLSFAAAGLPFGLTLDPDTGAITGTPTVAGVYTVALSATNNNGTGDPRNLTLTVGSLSVISSAATRTVTQNQAMAAFTLTATNSPLSFNVTGLPPGLSATTAGVISGTPTTVGTFVVTVSANNAVGTGPDSTLTLTVNAPSGGGGGATAPVFTTQPVSQTVNAGASVSFTVQATGSAGITYQWRKDGAAIAGATGTTLTIAAALPADAGSYTVVATNAGGSTASSTATLTVVGLVTPPAITTQPAAQSGPLGGFATFAVVATGTNPLTYQWKKDGADIVGATAATLTLANLAATDAGSYTVRVGNVAGTVTSSAAVLTVTAASGPVIITQPAPLTLAVGGSGALSVVVNGTAPFTYQWTKGGVAIAGATAATLALNNAVRADTGTYAVTITNALGAVTSNQVAVMVGTSPRLLNLSTRGLVGAGEKMLIAGFVIEGTEDKPVLIRAVGQPLTDFDVAGTLQDPVLDLFVGSSLTTSNDTWGTAANAAAMASTAARVGAFALPANGTDAVILTTLQPGAYTAQVRGAAEGTGVGLVEIYDASEGTSAARLVNVATRGEVGTGGNILIAGFVIDGDHPKRVLVRAAGPALADFDISAPLANPQLQIFAGASVLAENDDWGSAGDAAEVASVAAAVGAFGFASGSADAAILVTLPPGVYTAQVSGAAGTTGIALVEVYEVP